MLKDLNSANSYYEQLKCNFVEDVVRKYPEVISKLKEENEKADKKLKSFMKNSKKVYI